MTNRPFGLVYEHPSIQQRTERVHRAIQEFIDVHGYPPGYRDIMDLADISSLSVVRSHLKRLAGAGTIRSDARIARSIVLLRRVEVE